MIKLIAFDMGGVIMEIDPQQAQRHFEEIGVRDAAAYLDPYAQKGFFGDFEGGLLSAEAFRERLSGVVGKPLTHEQCAYGWTGYRKSVPQENLNKVLELRRRGYRCVLLSNTNPYMMAHARSADFDEAHHGIAHYFDALYLSYELRLLKPGSEIFQYVLAQESVAPEHVLFLDDSKRNVDAAAALGIRTFQPADAHCWLEDIETCLKTR